MTIWLEAITYYVPKYLLVITLLICIWRWYGYLSFTVLLTLTLFPLIFALSSLPTWKLIGLSDPVACNAAAFAGWEEYAFRGKKLQVPKRGCSMHSPGDSDKHRLVIGMYRLCLNGKIGDQCSRDKGTNVSFGHSPINTKGEKPSPKNHVVELYIPSWGGVATPRSAFLR